MKKLFYILLAILSLTISSCSSENDSSSKPFTSTIAIDGVNFVPKEATAYDASTNLEHSIVFVLQKNLDTPTDLDEMVFAIYYPLNAENASGTYLMNGYQAVGNYTKGDLNFNFYNGSVLVEDLGNNKFNVTFQNVKGNIGNGNPQIITVTGSINGKFQPSN